MALIAWAKSSTRWTCEDVARLEMDLRDALVVAADEAEQDLGEEPALLAPEPAHDAEIDGDDAAILVDEEISLMHVGVEKPVAQRVAQEGLDQGPAPAPAGRSPAPRGARDRRGERRRSIPSSSLRASCGPSRPPARGFPGRRASSRRIPRRPRPRGGNPSPCAPSAPASRRPGRGAGAELRAQRARPAARRRTCPRDRARNAARRLRAALSPRRPFRLPPS